jgi:hypothetical protein
LVQPPKAVVFQVRRYRKNGRKADNEFHAPLTTHFTGADGSTKYYGLRVLFCHEGDGVQGHYVACVRDDIKKHWVRYSDSRKITVTKVAPKDIIGGLYFERVPMPTAVQTETERAPKQSTPPSKQPNVAEAAVQTESEGAPSQPNVEDDALPIQTELVKQSISSQQSSGQSLHEGYNLRSRSTFEK